MPAWHFWCCIAQLDYGITWQKLKDIFKVAGRIVNADILTDREGRSKGLGEVQFEDSGEAIGAIGEGGGKGVCKLECANTTRNVCVCIFTRSTFPWTDAE